MEETHRRPSKRVPQVEEAPAASGATVDEQGMGLSEQIESVGVPQNAVAEVQKLVPPGGDASFNAVLLAAIGVAGGGAAWKFYNDHSKRKHEQRMKELDRPDDSHQKCSVERAALEAKVTALETRLMETEKRAVEIPELPFDFDELRGRLEKLEKAAKTRRAARPKPEN